MEISSGVASAVHFQPAIIHYWETLKWDNSKTVGVIVLPADSPEKPYKARFRKAWVTFVRVGSTSREASREEEARLYRSSRRMRYDIKPVAGTDAGGDLYSDRLEVISPGRLPNTVTVEKMKQGYRAARNELIKEILRGYGYVEHRGMGVRYRIIQAMQQHNGTEPDLIEETDRFTVRLWKEAPERLRS